MIPTQKQIEKIGLKIHADLEMNIFDCNHFAKWHLQKMAEQEIKYAKLVEISKEILEVLDVHDLPSGYEQMQLRDILSEIQRSDGK